MTDLLTTHADLIITVGVYLLTQIAQVVTSHYSRSKGLIGFALWALEVASVLRSKGVPGLFKLPLTDAKPKDHRTPGLVIMLPLAALWCVSCAPTWQGKLTQGAELTRVGIGLTWEVVKPIYAVKCGKVAKQCKATPCPALKQCQAERALIGSILDGAETSTAEVLRIIPRIEAAKKGGEK